MNEERNGFVFLRSYYEALQGLPAKLRLAVYDALCAYAFTGQWPENLTGTALAVMQLIRPTLDTGLRRYSRAKTGGKRGGGNPNFQRGKPNPYYPKDNPEDNSKDNSEDNSEDKLNKDKEKDMDKDKDKERDKDMESPLGPYGNVLLSSAEMNRLQKNFPRTWQDEIDNLSRRLHEGKRLPHKRHYHLICDLFEQRIMEPYLHQREEYNGDL